MSRLRARTRVALIGAILAATGCSANPSGSPDPAGTVTGPALATPVPAATCQLAIRADEDRYIATGFPPDEQVTISFIRMEDGSRQTAAEPIWRTDARGRLEVYLAPSRADVGRHRVEFEAGGCVATGELEVPASRFPPECRHRPLAEGSPGASLALESDGPTDGAAGEIARDVPDAWWRLAETAEGIVRDQQGGHDGRHVGRVVPGVAGAHPAGVGLGLADGGWVDIEDLQLSGDFTIEAWVSLCDVIDAADALAGGDGAAPDLNFRDHRLRLWTGAVEAVIATTPATPAQWVHWAVVRRGSSVEIWRNGLLDAEGSFDGTFTIAGLGRGTVGTLSGALDEAAVWRRALLASRIRSHADATRS